MRHGETFDDGNIFVKAFPSTDIGNSYIIKRGEETIFHAGDLNAWIWKDESTEKEVETALNSYEKIVDAIAGEFPVIDIAMFPVDSRIGTDYFTGAKIFVRKIDVKRFFPMHFALGEDEMQMRKLERDATDIRAYANEERGEYICLTTPYSSYGYN